MNLWLRIFALSAFLFFVQCQRCPPTSEPLFSIQMNSQVPFVIRGITAVGAKSDSSLLPTSALTLNNYKVVDLPLSLHADSVQYYFDLGNRTDTLTLYYKRDFFYDKACGFGFDIKSPDNQEIKSTFKAAVVDYATYIPGLTFFGMKRSGIQIQIEL